MHIEGRGWREEDAEGLSTEAAVWDLLGKCWTSEVAVWTVRQS